LTQQNFNYNLKKMDVSQANGPVPCSQHSARIEWILLVLLLSPILSCLWETCFLSLITHSFKQKVGAASKQKQKERKKSLP